MKRRDLLKRLALVPFAAKALALLPTHEPSAVKLVRTPGTTLTLPVASRDELGRYIRIVTTDHSDPPTLTVKYQGSYDGATWHELDGCYTVLEDNAVIQWT